VCCESACNGTCMQCQAGSGRCVMPADDARCPSVACPEPASVCQQTSDITSNRCQSLGQCKTVANCATSAAANGTPCGEAGDIGGCGEAACPVLRICSQGSCISPSVSCAGQERSVSSSGCCILAIGGDFGKPDTFNTNPLLCGPGGGGEIVVTCDGQTDCATGYVCCANDSGNFNSIACRESCMEFGTQSPARFESAGTYRVCRSPNGSTSTCPQGRPCNRTHPDLPGWSFCQLP
jgi:hypothetical protein